MLSKNPDYTYRVRRSHSISRPKVVIQDMCMIRIETCVSVIKLTKTSCDVIIITDTYISL